VISELEPHACKDAGRSETCLQEVALFLEALNLLDYAGLEVLAPCLHYSAILKEAAYAFRNFPEHLLV
jgi:hypothetical protein